MTKQNGQVKKKAVWYTEFESSVYTASCSLVQLNLNILYCYLKHWYQFFDTKPKDVHCMSIGFFTNTWKSVIHSPNLKSLCGGLYGFNWLLFLFLPLFFQSNVSGFWTKCYNGIRHFLWILAYCMTEWNMWRHEYKIKIL